MHAMNTTKLPWGILSNVSVVVFCLMITACTSDEPLPVYPESGVKRDGIVWPDYRTKDLGLSKKDRSVKKDTEPHDGKVVEVKDGGNCTPVQATCSSACGAKEYCTESAGGTCATLATLAGDPSKKEVVLKFLMAVVPCWQQAPSDSEICATVDTCQMEGDLTEAMVTDWMCNEAQILDFPSSADYEAAKDICGCDTTDLKDMDWQVSVIRPEEKGKICLIFETSYIDEIFVDDCLNFPY